MVWTMSLSVYGKNNVSSKGSALPQLLPYTIRIVYYWLATYILKNNIDALCCNFSLKYRNSANIRQHLTVFPSYFNNIFLKYFRILQNLMRKYKILWKLTKAYKSLQKFTKVDESYDISGGFFGQITYCRSVSFNCNVLLAFCNFVPWWMKFFCFLLYRFASRQHRQIFCHHQMKGDISNIADT